MASDKPGPLAMKLPAGPGFFFLLPFLFAIPLAMAAPVPPPLFKVAQDHRVGFVSADGTLIVPPTYEGCAARWTEGYLWVVRSLADYVSGNFIGSDGQELLPRPAGQYVDEVVLAAPAFWNGRALIQAEEGKMAVAFPGGWIAPGADARDADLFPHEQDGGVGFVDSQGREVLPARYEKARPFHGGLAPAMIGNQWGLIDTGGQWVLAPELDDIITGEQGCWMATRSGKIGLLRPDGSWSHEPAFDEIGRWAPGVATVRQGEQWGLLNIASGELPVRPAYEEINYLGEASGWARRDGTWGLLGWDGTRLLPFEYDSVLWISPEAGLWRAKQKNLDGLIGSAGDVLLPCAYRSLDKMTDRFIVARTDEGDGLFDVKKQSFAVPTTYRQVITWEGLADNSAAVRTGNRWGLIRLYDETLLLPLEHDIVREWYGLVEVRKGERVALFDSLGKAVLPWSANATEIPDAVTGLTNGMGKVVCGGKAGLIDDQGAIRLPCQYADVGLFSEGLVPAKEDGKWGFADLKGEWAIPPEYPEVHPFSDGLAAVRQAGQVGAIDPAGAVQIPFEYADAGVAQDGLMPVAKEQNGHIRWGLIHTDGNEILPLVYDALEWVDFGPAGTRIHGAVTWKEY